MYILTPAKCPVNVFLLSVVRVGIGTLDYQRVYV